MSEKEEYRHMLVEFEETVREFQLSNPKPTVTIKRYSQTKGFYTNLEEDDVVDENGNALPSFLEIYNSKKEYYAGQNYVSPYHKVEIKAVSGKLLEEESTPGDD